MSLIAQRRVDDGHAAATDLTQNPIMTDAAAAELSLARLMSQQRRHRRQQIAIDERHLAVLRFEKTLDLAA